MNSNKSVLLVALMTALICVIAPISIFTPFSVVPISLSIFIIVLTVYILGLCKSLISIVLYILIGFCGLPVFSGFTGGAAKLLGPTGGYIIGYIFLVIISGYTFEKFSNIKLKFFGSLFGLIVLYVFGSLWLSYSAGFTFIRSLLIGVMPFIIFDILKILLAIYIGDKYKKVLKINNLL